MGLLPFGVALLAAARLATGEGRALALVVLAGSLAVQSHLVWALPVALVSSVGLALAAAPGLRRRLGVPTATAGFGAGSLLAALAVLLVLWALPLLDELVGDYGNLHRILAAAGRSRPQPVAGGRRGRGERLHRLRRLAPRPGIPFTLARRRRAPGPGAGVGRLARGDGARHPPPRSPW